MNRRSDRSFFSSPVTATLAALAISGLCAVPAIALAGRIPHPQTRAAIGNPVEGNEGFTAFIHHDAVLASHEDEGTMALGGDLHLGGLYNVALHEPVQPYYAPGESVPTGLLVGGRIDWATSTNPGLVRVLDNTLIHIGDKTGTDILNTGQPTQLVPTGGTLNDAQRVELSTEEETSAVVKPNLIDFDSAFAAYDQRSADMAACPNNVVPTDANGTPLTQPWTEGTQAYLTLDTTRTNVWTVTKEQLALLANITLRNLPTEAGSLVINVLDDTGTFDWNVTNLANFGDAAAPYTLWNFPTTTTLTMTGSNSLDGTFYAPHAKLIDEDPGNVQGNIIVDSLVHGSVTGGADGGEIHDFPFLGHVDCTAGTITPTPTETETGVTPT
ncbi:choice-of-anchor A family protein, partial [Actinospica durhamensis]